MKYEEKILPIFKDSLKFYEEYDICDHEFKLHWNPELKRYIII